MLLKLDFNFQRRWALMAVYRLHLVQAEMQASVKLEMMKQRRHTTSWPPTRETSSSRTLREAQAQMNLASTTQLEDHQVSSPVGLACRSTQAPGELGAS